MKDLVRPRPVFAGLAAMVPLRLDADRRDDAGFVDRVGAVVRGVLRVYAPTEAHVVKIDSWFGQRWLGFSHKALGRLGIGYSKNLRIPPFVPARVASQRDYLRTLGGRYFAYQHAPPLHIRQTSEANQRRLVSTLCPGAALLWWSGATADHGRGSLMAYLPGDDGHAAWYAELARDAGGGWRTSRTSGISAHELERYAEGDATPAPSSNGHVIATA